MIELSYGGVVSDLPSDASKLTALKCLQARLRDLLPNINTVSHRWIQRELENTPDRHYAFLNDYMRSYVQVRLSRHPVDPLFLNIDMIWKSIITGRTNLVNTNPDLVTTPTLGTGQWADTIMSFITLPALGLQVMAESLVDLDTDLGV